MLNDDCYVFHAWTVEIDEEHNNADDSQHQYKNAAKQTRFAPEQSTLTCLLCLFSAIKLTWLPGVDSLLRPTVERLRQRLPILLHIINWIAEMQA